MSTWISVEERLPAPGQVVLRYGIAFQICFFPEMARAHIDRGELVNRDGYRWADWGVTHWQPVPVMKARRHQQEGR